jgi:hypothetical protein
MVASSLASAARGTRTHNAEDAGLCWQYILLGSVLILLRAALYTNQQCGHQYMLQHTKCIQMVRCDRSRRRPRPVPVLCTFHPREAEAERLRHGAFSLRVALVWHAEPIRMSMFLWKSRRLSLFWGPANKGDLPWRSGTCSPVPISGAPLRQDRLMSNTMQSLQISISRYALGPRRKAISAQWRT